jgi:hypothetical protein
VRICEPRSRLLGLDQPVRADADVLANVTVDQLDAEIERLVAGTGAMPAPALLKAAFGGSAAALGRGWSALPLRLPRQPSCAGVATDHP